MKTTGSAVPCAFLQRAPREVRDRIYGYVFGSDLLHLVPRRRKLGHVRYSLPHGEPFLTLALSHSTISNSLPVGTISYSGQVSYGSQLELFSLPESVACEPNGFESPVDAKSAEKRTVLSNSLGLIKTCRQIYIEAGPILYTHAAFHFSNTDVFGAFVIRARPDRLSSIRRLLLTFANPPHHGMHGLHAPMLWPGRLSQDWPDFWQSVGHRMPGLRGLTLMLYTSGHLELPQQSSNADPDRWPAWMRAMLEVRGLRSCKIFFALPQQLENSIVFVINPDSELEPCRTLLERAMEQPRESTLVM